MAYVTTDYYLKYHKGMQSPVNAGEFDFYEKKARQLIDFKTLNKSQTYTEEATELRDAMCEIIDKLKAFDADDKYNKGAISSEKVGEYSVTYSGGVSEIEKIKDNEINQILTMYLGMSGLLYRGQ